jgi:hypothetical protein
MMKKTILGLFLLLALALVLFGCTGTDPKTNPKGALAEFMTKSSTLDNYYSKYEVSIGGGGALMGGVSYTIPFESWKKGNNYKLLMSMSLMGASSTAAYFTIGDRKIMCTESSYSMYTTSTTPSVDCQLETSQTSTTSSQMGLFSVPKNLSMLNDLNVVYLGEKKIADKFDCSNFRITLAYADFLKLYDINTISSMSSYSGTKFIYDICFDKKSGFIDEIKVAATGSSVLSGSETTTDFFTMTIQEYSNGVDDKEFKIPVPFSVSGVNCTKSKIDFNLIPFNSITSVDINASTSSYYVDKETNISSMTKTVNVSPTTFEAQKLTTTFDSNLWSTTSVNFCNNGVCVTKSCYLPYEYPDYSTDYSDYNYDDYSDYSAGKGDVIIQNIQIIDEETSEVIAGEITDDKLFLVRPTIKNIGTDEINPYSISTTITDEFGDTIATNYCTDEYNSSLGANQEFECNVMTLSGVDYIAVGEHKFKLTATYYSDADKSNNAKEFTYTITEAN